MIRLETTTGFITHPDNLETLAQQFRNYECKVLAVESGFAQNYEVVEVWVADDNVHVKYRADFQDQIARDCLAIYPENYKLIER